MCLIMGYYRQEWFPLLYFDVLLLRAHESTLPLFHPHSFNHFTAFKFERSAECYCSTAAGGSFVRVCVCVVRHVLLLIALYITKMELSRQWWQMFPVGFSLGLAVT